MTTAKPSPDPGMKVVVIASLSPQEAALLAGCLQADGIRAMVAPSQTAPGPWAAGFIVAGGLPLMLGPNPLQRGSTDVLVDERDAEEARRIALQYLEQ
jgi:hypothetical protein